MIRDMKRAFRLIQFSYNFKAYVIFGLIFTLFGVILAISTGPDLVWGRYGGLFSMVGAFFPTQMIYSLAVSEEVLVSPLRKTLLTKMSAFLHWGMQLAILAVISIIRGIQGRSNPEIIPFACGEILILTCFGAALILYGVLALKYFWLPTILFCFGYPLFSTIALSGDRAVVTNLPYPIVLCIGIGIITVGVLAGYLLALLVYKKPVSKMSQSAQLRQYI